MVIKLSKFGEILTSRPAGHDAYLGAKAYLISQKSEKIKIDFRGVKVLTPAWMDEFISPLQKEYGKDRVVFGKSENPSVVATLEMLSQTFRH